MRRRHHLRPLPRHRQRAIVAFPDPLLAEVEAFRATYDPLALRLPAHVTLAFPFASGATDVQLIAHIRRVSRQWPHLPITLAGIGAYHAQWVHLRVARGRDALIELHDRLYRGVLSPYLRREFPYEPHVTIGWTKNAEDCAPVLEAARGAFSSPIAAVVRELVLLEIATKDGVQRRATVPLGV